MQKRLSIYIALFFFSFLAFSQSDISTVVAYWGEVSSHTVAADQLVTLNRIVVEDTIKQRRVSEIQKFRFIVQPVLSGPVQVAETFGSFLSSQMKGFLLNPQHGDRIIVTDIYANVAGEGLRKIPAALVFIVE
ncbi:hypothetical protein ACFLRI_01260 [Bacteroidota bacterium]